ncbi:hypothetical protein H0178_27885 [Cytobacillus firmus]|jgi:hypothetical protein|nr:hypothetical protein [Cytobacillus firmus]
MNATFDLRFVRFLLFLRFIAALPVSLIFQIIIIAENTDILIGIAPLEKTGRRFSGKFGFIIGFYLTEFWFIPAF